MIKFLTNKIILITGGTGSFGTALLKKITKLRINVKEIRVFSRDEKKQDDLRKFFKSKNIKYIIGDIRDKETCVKITKDVDFVFHAAALKQVPSCEFHPLEAVKTNILGTQNLLASAIENKVKKVVCLSTDKAVYPINAMGISKALMEKVAISSSLNDKSKTDICVTRYGNVIGSRGSVIPLMINQIKLNKPITITHKNMSRFLMSLEDAMDLVFYAFKNGKNGQLFIKKTYSATLPELAKAVMKLCGKKNHPIKYIGIRHGEKIYETLLSKEESVKSYETKDYFIVDPDTRSLNYNKYFTEGKKNKLLKEYSSNSNKMLNSEKIVKILKKIDNIKYLIKDR